MKKKSFLLLLLCSLCLLSFKDSPAIENKVLIYGLIINNGCQYDPETTVDYEYEIVDQSNYKEATIVLSERLSKKYPEAKRIETGSSYYQYGGEAAAIVILKQTSFYPGKCQYINYVIGFGKSEDEALITATKYCITSTYIRCDVLLSKTW